MSRHHYDHIKANEKFHALVARKSRLGWGLAALVLLVYYTFILVVAFTPESLGQTIYEGSVLTWGLPIGAAVIVFAFVITGIYVHRANTIYDGLMQDVVDASHEHVDNLEKNNNN